MNATPRPPSAWHTLALTTLAMLAFAANSLLCRMALQQALIDPASFGSVRLASGALMLALIVRARAAAPATARVDWLAASMLFAYVVCFSFAYVTLAAGTGALVLFGAVQLTMFAVGLRHGERFAPMAWGGFMLALAGLVYLVSPGMAAPAPLGTALMAAAGIAWGVYSLRGRGAGEPVTATAGNFLRATPFALAVSAGSLAFAGPMLASAGGIALAVASGALTSGLGYVVWYAALPGLSALRAATVQLSVPPLAAVGGVLLLAESPTWRLGFSSLAILGGIAMVLFARSLAAQPRDRA
jgi:drug/metabolite transporter (DMT)-like permease